MGACGFDGGTQNRITSWYVGRPFSCKKVKKVRYFSEVGKVEIKLVESGTENSFNDLVGKIREWEISFK